MWAATGQRGFVFLPPEKPFLLRFHLSELHTIASRGQPKIPAAAAEDIYCRSSSLMLQQLRAAVPLFGFRVFTTLRYTVRGRRSLKMSQVAEVVELRPIFRWVLLRYFFEPCFLLPHMSFLLRLSARRFSSRAIFSPALIFDDYVYFRCEFTFLLQAFAFFIRLTPKPNSASCLQVECALRGFSSSSEFLQQCSSASMTAATQVVAPHFDRLSHAEDILWSFHEDIYFHYWEDITRHLASIDIFTIASRLKLKAYMFSRYCWW